MYETMSQRYQESKKQKKKFVRYQEAMHLYSIGLTKLKEITEEAGAVYRIRKITLVNTERLDEYLEQFRIIPERERLAMLKEEEEENE